MKMLADVSFVDTNVLVEAIFENSEKHKAAKSLLDRARSGRISLCVCPQVLAEFYAVVTSPRRITNPVPPKDALAIIEALVSLPNLIVLNVPSNVVEQWLTLVRRRGIRGPKVFDVMLVAIMLTNGIESIYTYNRADFVKFSELKILTP